MQQVYKVRLEVVVCVLADSVLDAKDVAVKALHQGHGLEPEGSALLVETVARLPKAWLTKRPIGATFDDPRTCRDHLLVTFRARLRGEKEG